MKTNYSKIQISVVQGDVLTFHADVLVLKYAQMFFGVDKAVAERFSIRGGYDTNEFVVENGKEKLFESNGLIAATHVLFVGVKWLYTFGYLDIREFARRALRALSQSGHKIRHLAMTLHGAGYGLDEVEAFEAEIAGVIDAINRGDFPETLERISIVEINDARAQRLSHTLDSLLPKGYVETDIKVYFDEVGQEAGDRLRAAGYASETKPHVFVAMSFKEEMDDVYHYGIQGAVRKAGFVCERADLSTFTGDVLEWVKRRIKNASLVIADLSDANPNVYLEVGYAWGVGIPTILLTTNPSDLKFDVRGQRCLIYKRIKDLENVLTNELKGLQRDMDI